MPGRFGLHEQEGMKDIEGIDAVSTVQYYFLSGSRRQIEIVVVAVRNCISSAILYRCCFPEGVCRCSRPPLHNYFLSLGHPNLLNHSHAGLHRATSRQCLL